jgi:hypothetical protein
MPVISAGPEGPRSGRRGTASRVHGTCVSLGLGREKSRVRGRKARSGEDLVMFKGPFGEVPRPPELTPLDSPPPSRPHRLLVSPAYLLGAWEAICVACAFGAGPCVDMPGLGRGGMQSGRESDKVHVLIQVEGLIGVRLIEAMRAAVLVWPE